MIGRGNRSTRRKSVAVPLFPPQMPHDLTKVRTRAAAVGSRRLTAWATSWPSDEFILEPDVLHAYVAAVDLGFRLMWLGDRGFDRRYPSVLNVIYRDQTLKKGPLWHTESITLMTSLDAEARWPKRLPHGYRTWFEDSFATKNSDYIRTDSVPLYRRWRGAIYSTTSDETSPSKTGRTGKSGRFSKSQTNFFRPEEQGPTFLRRL
jgi:hypothetical protein